MGDGVDTLTDQGVEELALHERGECDQLEPCPYCAEGEEGERECCVNGHAPGCESLEPAWDIGDLISRYPCSGCCPNGHGPEGLQAEQDAAADRARRFLTGKTL